MCSSDLAREVGAFYRHEARSTVSGEGALRLAVSRPLGGDGVEASSIELIADARDTVGLDGEVHGVEARGAASVRRFELLVVNGRGGKWGHGGSSRVA